MSETAAFPNVLNACSVEGRLVLLQGLAEQLESCQKSLSDYLDSKRSIFPRCVLTPGNSRLGLTICSAGPGPRGEERSLNLPNHEHHDKGLFVLEGARGW